MTKRIFDFGTEFGEGTIVALGCEEGIVAKTFGA
jgi:hypothetical protein